MNKDNIKAQIVVKNQTINVLRIEDEEYISLTDLARYADEDEYVTGLLKEEWIDYK